MTQTRPDPFASGGPDTYTAPDEYFVDPDLSADAVKRQYASIAAALTAGVTAGASTITIRLSNGKSHDWDGSNLPAGVSASVVIYSNAPAGNDPTVLNLQSGTYDSEGSLTIAGVQVSTGASVIMEVTYLTFLYCTGVLLYSTDDTPTVSSPQHVFRWCDISMGITVAATETFGGAVQLYDCIVTFGDQGQDFFDFSSAASSFWEVQFNKCQILAVDSHDTFVDDTGINGDVLVSVRDSTFILRGFGFGTLTLKDQGDGITWVASRIVVDPFNKPGDDFQFGTPGTNEGQAYGLEIEYSGSFGSPLYPTDCPDGTVAKGLEVFPSAGQLVFDSQIAQWRGPNRTVYFEGSTGAIPGIGVPVILDTVIEGDTLARVSPGSPSSLYRLKGTIFVGVEGDGGVWEVDAILSANGAPSAASFLSGDVPTVLYTSDPTEFDIVLLPVSGAEEGFQVQVTKNSTTSNLGISAAISITAEVN
jgi:hypothetical protein